MTPRDGGPTVAALVLTYDAPENVLACVRAVAAQTVPVAFILVIENPGARRVRPDALRDQAPGAVRLVTLDENLGPAGGYAEGLRMLAESDCDAIWVLDDDVLPEPDCLSRARRGAATAAGVPAARGGATRSSLRRIPGPPGLLLPEPGTPKHRGTTAGHPRPPRHRMSILRTGSDSFPRQDPIKSVQTCPHRSSVMITRIHLHRAKPSSDISIEPSCSRDSFVDATTPLNRRRRDSARCARAHCPTPQQFALAKISAQH